MKKLLTAIMVIGALSLSTAQLAFAGAGGIDFTQVSMGKKDIQVHARAELITTKKFKITLGSKVENPAPGMYIANIKLKEIANTYPQNTTSTSNEMIYVLKNPIIGINQLTFSSNDPLYTFQYDVFTQNFVGKEIKPPKKKK